MQPRIYESNVSEVLAASFIRTLAHRAQRNIAEEDSHIAENVHSAADGSNTPENRVCVCYKWKFHFLLHKVLRSGF
jgi:hypothetical protein